MAKTRGKRAERDESTEYTSLTFSIDRNVRNKLFLIPSYKARILKMIAVGNKLFSIADNLGFTRLTEKLELHHLIPCSKMFTQEVLSA